MGYSQVTNMKVKWKKIPSSNYLLGIELSLLVASCKKKMGEAFFFSIKLLFCARHCNDQI